MRSGEASPAKFRTELAREKELASYKECAEAEAARADRAEIEAEGWRRASEALFDAEGLTSVERLGEFQRFLRTEGER